MGHGQGFGPYSEQSREPLEVTKGTTQEVEASSSRSRSEAAKMRRDVIGRNAEKQEKGPGLGGTCS